MFTIARSFIAARLPASLKMRAMCACDELNHISAARSGWDAVGPLIRAKHEQLAAMREANGLGAPKGVQDISKPNEADDAPKSAQEVADAARAENEESSQQGPNDLTEAEQKMVRELQARDREVRAHEQAHATVGGQYAGAPSYTYQSGPDGGQYAVGGEVPIDISPIKGDPKATIAKMQVVIAAALAPAEPSGQDRKVASMAQSMQAQAYSELTRMRTEERNGAAVDLRA